MIFKGTQKELDRKANVGSYLYNTNRIAEAVADGSDTVMYYTRNKLDPRNPSKEYKIDEAKTVVDALLWTSSDGAVVLPVLKKKVNAKTEDYAKTITVSMSDIALGWADPSDATKSWIEVYPNGFKKIEYQVNLSVDQISGFANILTYKFLDSANAAFSGGDRTGVIDHVAGTITISVPALTTVTALVATFTLNEGASAKVGSTAQVSGTTANDLTNPISIVVTSKYGNTKTYTVTCTVLS